MKAIRGHSAAKEKIVTLGVMVSVKRGHIHEAMLTALNGYYLNLIALRSVMPTKIEALVRGRVFYNTCQALITAIVPSDVISIGNEEVIIGVKKLIEATKGGRTEVTLPHRYIRLSV